jgi:biotin carboxyl carrier protein
VSNQIFRPAALERLSSPEQLDRLLPITSPRGWVALAGLGMLLAAALLWGLFGRVYSTVEGQGILLRQHGIKRVVAPQAGVVSRVLVSPGQRVYTHQRLVQLDPHFLPPRPRPPAAAPKDERPGAGPDKQAARPKEAEAADVDLPAMRDTPFLFSTHAGQVLEVFVEEGSVIDKGTLLMTVEPPGDRLQALVYVPVGDGQKVQPGMRVEISPSTAKKSEFGYLLGTVTKVSHFPASHEAMKRILENEELVRSLTRDSPCLQIAADLIADGDTVSGYRWSSSQGPPAPLYSGTPCRALITVRQQRPVRLVVPTVRDLLGF